ENAYLQEEIRIEMNASGIVGASAPVQAVLRQIHLVAPTGATVLITGESGTGKELIARAIHEASDRRDRPLIRVNCAAIPRELFESEFFGHVRGAFTGAIRDRIGRFELADGGTLFLDEVGEIPLELQSKLLRVLQEGVFERVGEEKTRSVNVRLIAATNRDLKQAVQRRQFREDLYFRLNVFPIVSVPLRERRDDIPLLAQHFLDRESQSKRMDLRFSEADIRELCRYDWPGNVRELQNVIERAAILSQNGRLTIDLPDTHRRETTATRANQKPAADEILTDAQLRDLERDNLVAALTACGCKVSGPSGAARLLGMKPTTLASRIKAFGLELDGLTR
ncbi:MAG: sigma 54-interacting transcriptional regulator, partial [Rhizobiales bacterium]|nr:sigma 54-interacting transcriptional regulator [Hyphomicrobiales bacterium]